MLLCVLSKRSAIVCASIHPLIDNKADVACVLGACVMNNFSVRIIGWLLALVIFVLLLLAGNKVKQIISTPAFTKVSEINTACDLRQQACQADFDDETSVQFSLSPSDIPLLTPLQATVMLKGIQAEKVMIDVIGLNMDMGYNRPQLINDDEQTYIGSLILPVCTLERMEWEARIIVYTSDDEVLMAPFRFYTFREN